MALFVVQHKHDAETCPAGHPEMGPALVQHVSPANTAKFGVDVKADAVVDGAHTFYLIIEAPSATEVESFMTPFSQMGSVDIWPSSSCERVVARGKC